MPPMLEAAAGEYHGQVRVRVGAGIAHTAAKDHGGVVQQGTPADVLHGGEPLEKVIQLRHQRGLDEVQLPQLVRVLTTVGKIVVTAVDPGKVRHRQCSADVQGDDAGGVGL